MKFSITVKNMFKSTQSTFLKFFLLGSSLFVFACLWMSCEKEVQFNLKEGQNHLVVEGRIETHEAPIVRLTKSIGFFETIDWQTLSNSFIHDARVTVFHGSDSFQLKEYLGLLDGTLSYYYTIDSSDLAALTFLGQEGEIYRLKIVYQDQVYTSSTIIPHVKGIDSLRSAVPPIEELPADQPYIRRVFARYTDPDTPGNRVRYFIKQNQLPFTAPFFATYDDQLVNGSSIEMPIFPPFIRGTDSFNQFKLGDTIIMKWCAIDEAVFDFWQTLEYSYTASGNPFASPVEVGSNIQGGALGIWAGYGSSFDTLIIRE